MNPDKIAAILLNTGWGGDLGPDSDAYKQIQEILREEFDRGFRLGREATVDELEQIVADHLHDHPHRGTVSLLLDLLEERLDLK